MFRAPLCPSSGAREYYTDGSCLWYLVLWFSTCQYGVELRVMCPVCGLLLSTFLTTMNGQNHFKLKFTFMLPCCIVIDFFLNNQPDALIIQIYSVIELYMFRASSLTIIRSFLLYIRHCMFHPDSASKRLSKTYMNLTSAECTVENSWWWAERMPETCRVL